MKPKKPKPPKYDNLKAAMGQYAALLRTREEIENNPDDRAIPSYYSTEDGLKKGVIRE